jgi:UDP-N-acetylglucosamine 2-epimerase
MKVVTVVGARPQFIKAMPVSKALLQAGHVEILVHTGQHYDDGMSAIFFRELDIPEPHINLGIGSGSHGWQTAKMLIRLEEVILSERPNWVIVYGDTNSTLAGALAAAKIQSPLAHVEAGLRSYNREMPEEHNRVIADHCADLLFCPTKTAVDNLAREGLTKGVHMVGDTMYDSVLEYAKKAQRASNILKNLDIEPKCYFLSTIHRPYNTDNPENLMNILMALRQMPKPVVLPVHPRTRQKLAGLSNGLRDQLSSGNVKLIEPVGYLDMLVLEQNAQIIITDSGGMQKEALFLGVPCVTLRPETEWTETVEYGWNTLVAARTEAIVSATQNCTTPDEIPSIFGDGSAAGKIASLLMRT